MNKNSNTQTTSLLEKAVTSLCQKSIAIINNNATLREGLVGFQAKYTPRKYAVLVSGHGSAYRFDGNDPDRPPFPLLTKEQAEKDADHWCSIADTIGGNAQVYDASEMYKRKYRKSL